MTHFLQRLAERAMGVRQSARVVSMSPYAPAPLLTERKTMANQPLSSLSDTRPDNGVRSESTVPQPQPEERISPIGPEKLASSDTVASQAKLATVSYDQSTESESPLGTEPDELTGINSLQRQPQEIVVRLGSQTVHKHVESPAAAAPQLESQLSSHTTNEPAYDLFEPALSGHVLIKPLLPLTRGAASNIRPSSEHFAPPHPSAAGGVEETTEVHVSIGRIEVTAVQEPAPSKQLNTRASRRQQPMSLDDYLARRHGRHS